MQRGLECYELWCTTFLCLQFLLCYALSGMFRLLNSKTPNGCENWLQVMLELFRLFRVGVITGSQHREVEFRMIFVMKSCSEVSVVVKGEVLGVAGV